MPSFTLTATKLRYNDSEDNTWVQNSLDIGRINNSTVYTGFCWFDVAQINEMRALYDEIHIYDARIEFAGSRINNKTYSVHCTLGITDITSTTYSRYSWPFANLYETVGNYVFNSAAGEQSYKYFSSSELDVIKKLANPEEPLRTGLIIIPWTSAVVGNHYYSSGAPTLVIDYEYKKSALTVTPNPVELGGNLTANISSWASKYTHKLTCKFGTESIVVNLSEGVTSYTFNGIPVEWAAQMPDAAEKNGEVVLETFYEDKSYGTSIVNVAFRVPNSLAPSVGTIKYAVTNTLQLPISKHKLTASLEGSSATYGATIKTYSLAFEGYTSSNEPLTVESIPLIPSQSQERVSNIVATVTDSRGMTSQSTLAVTIYDWDVPYFTTLSARRCNSSGTITEDGHFAKVEGAYGCYSVNGENSIQSCTLQIVRKSTGEVTDEGSWNPGVSARIIGGSMLSNEEYIVKVALTDRLTTIVYELAIYTAYYVIHFKAGGTGVAFGQAATEDKAVKINPEWKLVIGNNLDVAEILADLMSRVDALDGGNS